ncbi:nitrate- and nitrite sensing domain-containing protein [Streptomyces cocklensis]|uniref:histidine kinase n=1 Tax=Actinacidiphila cocklensis TaxID=887465 RepID=A0A9W4E2X8_9ACTN|nr:nitrate- and nitrite sensing domain-containing protein [Actinacidiphila cocklensis]MDD1060134.1 nitrate- and nitrite sensing domain-containing protein [Actinacidiphila cocklensis]CAG6391712.1 Histidine kinase [Actinacidiphila cocklensis]
MQGRFKRDSGAAGDPEQQPGGTGNGPAQAAGDSGGATPGTAAATGRTSTPSGIEAGRITGLDGKPGSRILMRNWRISTRLVSLLALPVVTAGALGGLRIHTSMQNIGQLQRMNSLTDIAEHATDLADALAEERDSSAGPLSAGSPTDAVAASRQTTDREYKLYRDASDNISSNDSLFSGVRSSLIAIDTQLTQLSQLRDQAFTSQSSIAQTVSSYDGLIQSLLGLSVDMAQATQNSEMVTSTRALAAFSSAKEYESIQRAVISAALAKGGHLDLGDYQSVKSAAANEDINLTRFTFLYGPKSAELIKPISGGNDTISAHDTMRERIAATPDAIDGINISYLDWDDAARAKIDAMNRIERSLLNEMRQKSLELQSTAKQDALIAGAIILLVLGVAVVGAFVVARSMIRSLRRLQQTAQDVAQKRLPELVKQLSDTDPQDVDTSVESIGINSRDEIGQVARAFDEVHSEAVRLAAEQALLRGNVNAMFTNLSRRSQGLIQRQLSLISELESREADPDQLSSLFKLDHLATRMRRNGENLLVLAGEEPGRRWTRPVPLVDVLRAAASEVEQYERIELTSVPSAEVTGRIVNDLVHLLAELLENATSFSSPQTKVRVTGHALPDGRVLIEIHDTGIGLSPEDLADINERLANPPTVDVAVSRRMGLFVVGRLSLRHGIRIQLRPSDSGGTTALVMLPVDVTQGGAGPKGNAMGGARAGATPPAPAAGGGSGVAAAFGSAPNAQQVPKAPQRGQVGGGAQRPALAPGAGRPGGAAPQQPGTPRWAAQDGSQGFPADDRGLQDTPRGHEDVEASPAFDAFDGSGQDTGARADFRQGGTDDAFGAPQQGGQGGPGGQFPSQPQPPQPQGTGPSGFRSDVFGGRPGPRQGGGTDQQRPQGGPGDTAQFPAVPAARDDFQQGGTGQFPPQRGNDGQDFGRGPRTPQETYGTGQFPVQGGPGDNGQFARPGHGRTDGTGQFPVQGGPGDTGQFARPGQALNDGTGQFPVQGDNGQFARPGHGRTDGTGQFPVQGGPGDTGQFPAQQQPGQGGPGDTAQFPAVRADDTFGGGTGQFAPPAGGRPQGGTGYRDGGVPQSPFDTTGRPQMPGQERTDVTGQHPVAPQQGMPGTPFQQRPGQQPPQPQQPSEPMALPPAQTRGDEPTPIFSAIESDWFRTGQAERMQQIHVEQSARGQQAPAAPRPVGRTAPPQRPRTERPTPAGPQRPGSGAPQQQAPQSAPAPAAAAASAPPAPSAQPLPRETPNWRTSPNDALRQRAEAVREPSAGGVTPSGLPRRVPRANLVAGGAAQPTQPQPGGPQVSRSPDDVRGRLTNLRRGIQQGREAGGTTDGRGFGTNHQER